jgi:hypothetical protein
MDNSTKATPFQWDDEKIACLIRLKKEGLPHSGIAVKMGVTKGSINGKLRRLGMFKPYPNGARKPKEKMGKDFVAAKSRLLAANGNPHLPPGALSILDLKTDDCRWPVTDRPPHLFCGRQKWGGSSYCACHTSKAWRREI